MNLARPEANVTGLSNLSEELTGKRMQLFKDVLPRVLHVAVLWNAGNPVSTIMFKQAEAAALRLGLQVQSVEVRRPDDFDQALAAVSGRPSTLFVVDDPLVFSQRALVAGFAVQHRLPSSAYYKEFVEAGGLMSLGPSLTYQFRRAAIFVDKILKGAKPGICPWSSPRSFSFSSTSRPPKPSASRFRRRCCCGQIKSLNR